MLNGGPCGPWADEDLLPCATYDTDPGLTADALDAATFILYELTHRRWPGECTDVVRPTGCPCRQPDRCGCHTPSAVRLPGYPVVAVDEVKLDGVVLATARYRVDDHRLLVYLPEAGDRRQRWPCCQRLDRADTEDGTFAVTYTHGTLPPPGGDRAAAALACQFIYAWEPALQKKCQLPKRVQTITRQGVTHALLDPMEFLEKGLTGIPEIDLWVQAANRGPARRRATVMVPGQRRRVRRTAT